MDTQKQTQGQHAEFKPSEVSSIRMAVIEHRFLGGHEWMVWLRYANVCEIEEGYLREKCEELARRYTEEEWRFRYGSLILEPSDKCVIFKP